MSHEPNKISYHSGYSIVLARMNKIILWIGQAKPSQAKKKKKRIQDEFITYNRNQSECKTIGDHLICLN